MAFRRRLAVGELTRPYPGLYVATDRWAALDPHEQARHIVRAVARQHEDWVFAGISAAAIHGLEHSWTLHQGDVTILSCGSTRRGKRLRFCHAQRVEGIVVGDVCVTDMARTVVDCAMAYAFRDALAIADSALAQGVTVEEIALACEGRACANVFRVLRYARATSENGGESYGRGTLIELGFEEPQLQVSFVDPQTGRTYRADFTWYLPDGRIIVGEFDGQRKYVDPEMTGGGSVSDVVLRERERQEGLKRAGVTTIFRFTFQDAKHYEALRLKAEAAGVPRA